MLHPQIETFLTVAGEGSFARASEKMFLSKVSIMKQISALESRLGIRLFERTNHGVNLTEAGEVFCEEAHKLRDDAAAALARTRAAAGLEKDQIRIGTSVLRPSTPLIDLWAAIDDGSRRFQFEMVPFGDAPTELNQAFASLGKDLDLIVAGIAADAQMEHHRFLPLGTSRCCIAVPKRHPLAAKSKLTWADLDGETMFLVRQGSTPVLDAMRREIEMEHPDIRLSDIQNPYDIRIFNECEKRNCVMETLELWRDVHPSLVTLPMDWSYEIPYGITYAEQPSPTVERFLAIIQEHLKRQSARDGT